MSLGLVQNQAQNKIIKGSIALATHLSKAGGRNLIESLISWEMQAKFRINR